MLNLFLQALHRQGTVTTRLGLTMGFWKSHSRLHRVLLPTLSLSPVKQPHSAPTDALLAPQTMVLPKAALDLPQFLAAKSQPSDPITEPTEEPWHFPAELK